jgi:2'-5' RNA ligase
LNLLDLAAVRLAGKTKDAPESHTGVAIMMFLPRDVATALALGPSQIPKGDKAELPEELHVTIAYLGDSTEGTLAKKRKAVEKAMEKFSKSATTVTGRISGFGTFDEGNGGCAIYYSFDAPGLPQLRHDLVAELKKAGVEINMKHGFSPHITLAYLKDKGDAKVIYPSGEDVTLDEITLGWGDERLVFTLGRSTRKPKVVRSSEAA